jgi:hypothetical protein
MSLMTLLEQAQGGGLYAAVARSLDLDDAETRKAMRKLCPAIAQRLQDKAAADPDLFQTLLDLIEEGAEGSPLDTVEALTGAEAVADGNAILEDAYGSRNQAMVALRAVDETIPERELRKLAPISATAVVAALAQANRPMALAASSAAPARSGTGGEGIIATLVSAIIAGIVSALSRQLTSRTRRRTARYSRTRSKRKTSRTPKAADHHRIGGGRFPRHTRQSRQGTGQPLAPAHLPAPLPAPGALLHRQGGVDGERQAGGPAQILPGEADVPQHAVIQQVEPRNRAPGTPVADQAPQDRGRSGGLRGLGAAQGIISHGKSSSIRKDHSFPCFPPSVGRPLPLCDELKMPFFN